MPFVALSLLFLSFIILIIIILYYFYFNIFHLQLFSFCRGINGYHQAAPPPSTSNTLGRYSKSTQRLASVPPSSTSITQHHHHHHQHDYRSTQTLPRKLADHHKTGNNNNNNNTSSSSTINVSIVNSVKHPPPPSSTIVHHNTGPAKPARTYKALNRSKSFNVHGLNGTNDPSPIYIEKLMNKSSMPTMYKSNPHLSEERMQLKSPSIVNLISRSQRDLTKIDEDSRYITPPADRRMTNGTTTTVYHRNNQHHHSPPHHHNNGNLSNSYDKRNVFLRGLQDQAPELYRTLHGDEEAHQSSLGSRSPPITLNKDTASIVRRGSSSTEDYSETYKITSKSDDPKRPMVTNTVHSFSKKTLPRRGGSETVESSERKTVTTSRYSGEPMSNLQYINGTTTPIRNGVAGVQRNGGPVVIEVRNRK